MKRWLFLITGLLCLVSCDQYQVVDTHDQDTKLINTKTCNCQIVPKDELKTLREQAELGIAPATDLVVADHFGTNFRIADHPRS